MFSKIIIGYQQTIFPLFIPPHVLQLVSCNPTAAVQAPRFLWQLRAFSGTDTMTSTDFS